MLTPTQRDRDAAWPHRPAFMTDTVATCRAWDAGEYDHLAIVQAFAQHTANTIEEAAQIAESGWIPAYVMIPEGGLKDDWRPGSPWDRGASETARRIASQIRALNTDTKDGRDG